MSNSGYIGLLLPLEQTQMTTYHYRPHNYKKNTWFSLPSQQSTFNAAQQWPWPLPPKPTPHMISWPSMVMTTSSASTRKSQISSTTSCTSSMLPPHPYHWTPLLPTKGKRTQLSNSSRRNEDVSGPSAPSLRWQRRTPPSSKGSSTTHPSPTPTGVSLTGGWCHNGNNHHMATDSPSVTWSLSHNNHHPSYNPCANESDHNNNETPNIVDLYSEEVYNNID